MLKIFVDHNDGNSPCVCDIYKTRVVYLEKALHSKPSPGLLNLSYMFGLNSYTQKLITKLFLQENFPNYSKMDATTKHNS